MPGLRIDIEIPEHIVDKADRCRKNHRCKGDSGNLCKVVCFMKDDICFVRCLDSGDCSYLEPHVKTKLCTCPVRIEIYKRYKI
jgi:hypothetical protein